MKATVVVLAWACALPSFADAAAPEWTAGGLRAEARHADEITPEMRARIWDRIDASALRLVLPKAGARPAFRWPLRAARGYYGSDFSRVSFHVDHDPAFPGQVRDFSCGARTYDRDNGYNHQGTDISIVPDSWNLMDAGQIEIVAAAAGTIVLKSDGNFDRNCAFGSDDWNAVYIQHDDGSIAWYGHMRNGSPTPKAVGARVAAGEYLGLVGSSGNSTGPHLHLEVYDANHRLVDPFAGQCNLKNADSWWESQPAYKATRVMALTTASAAPVSPACGPDGRLLNAGTYARASAFARGDFVYLVVNIRDLPAGTGVHYTLRDPSGAVWSTNDGTAATQEFPGAITWVGLRLGDTAPLGTWMAEASLGGSSVRVPFTLTADGQPIANYTDLWWNPSESGWGLNLSHQGEKLFATWFTYDSDGQGLWLVMPSGERDAQGAFAGSLYRTTGVPLAQIQGAPASIGTPAMVGSARLRFDTGEQASFSYTVNGVTQQKTLQRQRFAAAPTCLQTKASRADSTNYQDLWWNPAESGWGINFTHQGDTIFATWFTYGAGGRGQWLVAPDARRQPTGEFRGRLYRTTGLAFDRIAGAPAMTGSPADVGELAIAFSNGEHGRIDYSVDGVSQSKAIERQVFAAGAPLCR